MKAITITCYRFISFDLIDVAITRNNNKYNYVL